jgi:hypothetical protein
MYKEPKVTDACNISEGSTLTCCERIYLKNHSSKYKSDKTSTYVGVHLYILAQFNVVYTMYYIYAKYLCT